jgi:hypothetical protein
MKWKLNKMTKNEQTLYENLKDFAYQQKIQLSKISREILLSIGFITCQTIAK